MSVSLEYAVAVSGDNKNVLLPTHVVSCSRKRWSGQTRNIFFFGGKPAPRRHASIRKEVKITLPRKNLQQRTDEGSRAGVRTCAQRDSRVRRENSRVPQLDYIAVLTAGTVVDEACREIRF